MPPTAIFLTRDEVHFNLTGCVNKQNFQYCAGANPHAFYERPLHSERVAVLYAIREFGVLGLTFSKTRTAVQWPTNHYVCSLHWNVGKFLATTAVRACCWCRGHLVPIRWGQCTHRTKNNMLPEGALSRHIISHWGNIPWLAQSPDLVPCDFFLWGYLKGEVHKRPHNLVELKKVIREEIQQITPAMTVRVMNFERYLNSCINTQGHHMEHVVFQKKTALTCEFESINKSLIWWSFKTFFFACEIHLFFLAHSV